MKLPHTFMWSLAALMLLAGCDPIDIIPFID